MAGYAHKVGGIVTQFQDAFARGTLNPANQLVWLPTDQLIAPVSNPVNISDNFCDGTGNLVLSAYGSNNPLTVYPCFMPCLGLTYSAVSGQTQHCQVKFTGVGNAGVGGDAGPAVFITMNGQAGASCYMVVINNSSQITVARAFVSSSALGQVNLSAANFVTLSVNDILRLSCKAGSPNTITLLQNGTQIFSGTDSNLNSGIPGFCTEVCGTTGGVSTQFKFTNFDGGLGI